PTARASPPRRQRRRLHRRLPPLGGRRRAARPPPFQRLPGRLGERRWITTETRRHGGAPGRFDPYALRRHIMLTHILLYKVAREPVVRAASIAPPCLRASVVKRALK